jgi:hypothetical protein
MKLMIAICLITSLGFINQGYGAESDKKINQGDWKEAMDKWLVFANEHMERMKKHDLTLPRAELPGYKFDMEWVEVKSKLITKYLPDYKIFADRRFDFILDKKGHIICLGETWPLGRPFVSAPDLEVKKYSEFIRGLKIRVNDEETAIEMVKLKKIVYDGNGYVDDKELGLREQTWKYRTSKKNKIWYVRMGYIGPPASITGPPAWKIELDQDEYVRVIKELHLGFCDVNADGDCDFADVKKLEELLGECVPGSTKFNELADVDHDGCITNKDRELLLRKLSVD